MQKWGEERIFPHPNIYYRTFLCVQRAGNKGCEKMKDPFLCRLFSLCIELTHKYEMCLRQHSCCAESKRENRNANHSKRHRYLLKDQPLAAAK